MVNRCTCSIVRNGQIGEEWLAFNTRLADKAASGGID
jgi:hypothetical protein